MRFSRSRNSESPYHYWKTIIRCRGRRKRNGECVLRSAGERVRGKRFVQIIIYSRSSFTLALVRMCIITDNCLTELIFLVSETTMRPSRGTREQEGRREQKNNENPNNFISFFMISLASASFFVPSRPPRISESRSVHISLVSSLCFWPCSGSWLIAFERAHSGSLSLVRRRCGFD